MKILHVIALCIVLGTGIAVWNSTGDYWDALFQWIVVIYVPIKVLILLYTLITSTMNWKITLIVSSKIEIHKNNNKNLTNY